MAYHITYLSCLVHSRSSVAGKSINLLSFSCAFSSWRGGAAPADDSALLEWISDDPRELDMAPKLLPTVEFTFEGRLLLCMASMKQVRRSLLRRFTSISGCWSNAFT